jgi:serine/threonine-protein kinase
MDLLEGEPLSALLERDGAIEPRRLIPLALPILAGLGAAHAAGVVHRDLKPDNVFLARDASTGETTVKLLDFGIAKLTEMATALRSTGGLTQTGSVLGTPHYMAPEQVFGEKTLDHRADFWSLGVVLYEGLTGVCPIQGDNVGQLFKAISLRAFPSLRDKLPNAPRDLTGLVDTMLSLRPEDRPASAGNIAAILADVAGLARPSIPDPSWAPNAIRSSVAPPSLERSSSSAAALGTARVAPGTAPCREVLLLDSDPIWADLRHRPFEEAGEEVRQHLLRFQARHACKCSSRRPPPFPTGEAAPATLPGRACNRGAPAAGRQDDERRDAAGGSAHATRPELPSAP